MKMHTSEQDRQTILSDRFLHIHSCGSQYCDSYDYTVLRKNGRPDWHLLYVAAGICHADYAETTYTLSAGHFVIYPPSMPQKYVFLQKDRCRTYWVHFSGTQVKPLLEEVSLKGGVYAQPLSERAIAAFSEMIRTFQLQGYLHATIESAWLLQLLAVLAGKSRTGAVTEPKELDQAIFAMYAMLEKPYDGAYFARLCNLSPSRFYHKFKEVTGTPPHVYFLRLKLEKAKELLAFSTLRIAEIAAMVGYDNALYFSRLFCKYVGVPPMTYRKTHR